MNVDLTLEMLKAWLLEQPEDALYKQADDCECLVARYYEHTLDKPVRALSDGVLIHNSYWDDKPKNFNSQQHEHSRICFFIFLFDGHYDGIYDSARTKTKTLEIIEYAQRNYPAPEA